MSEWVSAREREREREGGREREREVNVVVVAYNYVLLKSFWQNSINLDFINARLIKQYIINTLILIVFTIIFWCKAWEENWIRDWMGFDGWALFNCTSKWILHFNAFIIVIKLEILIILVLLSHFDSFIPFRQYMCIFMNLIDY